MRVAVDRKPLAYIQTQVCVDYEECGCPCYLSYFIYLGFRCGIVYICLHGV